MEHNGAMYSSSTEYLDGFHYVLLREMSCGGHFMKNPAVPMSLRHL